MRFGKRRSRSSDGRRYAVFCPRREVLEERVLLAFDLGGNTLPALPNIAINSLTTAPIGPFGVLLAGPNTQTSASTGNGGGAAGFSVQNLGDVNGDGFDDFLVGGPGAINNNGTLALLNNTSATQVSSTVYLVFGSSGVGIGSSNWLNLNTTGQRVGDLGQLGQPAAAQTNPITGAPTFPYSGIKFVTSSPNSLLGASVSVIRNLNGQNAILIGAPGAADQNGNNPGTGRAYLIYTNPTVLNQLIGQTINLDAPTQPSGLQVVTFVNNAVGSQTGRSVAGLGDVFANGQPDIAIGAPTASIAGQINTGAVYVLSGAQLPTTTSTVLLQNVGQGVAGQTGVVGNGVPGVLFLGDPTLVGGMAGFSVADGGDVDGALLNARPVNDILIGAPGLTGRAYLVYGNQNLASFATLTNNVNFIGLNAINNNSATQVSGATFIGPGPNSMTGFAVASAGDFNSDGFGDIMIGIPGTPTNPLSMVDLVYGQGNTSTTTRVFGTIQLASPPTNVSVVNLTGASGSLAGYSLSVVGKIPSSANSSLPSEEIAIGAPLFNGGLGAVYIVPSSPTLLAGSYSLSESQPIAATLLTVTTPSSPTVQAFFGASVSSRLTAAGQTQTADSDTIADFIVGAPGYNVNNVTTGSGNRTFAGSAFILEGASVPIQIPLSTQITTQIGVGVAKSASGVFSVNATTPPALSIFVFSNASISPPFAPVSQINPRTIVVNGVAYPNATLVADPVDENRDGIPDAIITITPRSALNLTAASTILTISGRTLGTGANANMTWSGFATISVTGGGGGGGGGGVTGAVPVAALATSVFTPQFGPDQYVPPVAALSAYNYKAIPLQVALHQYLPPQGFRQRIAQYFFPKAFHNQFGSRKEFSGDRTSTLGRAVFTRGTFKPGKTISFTHEVPVVPTQRQHETYIPTPNPKLVAKRSLT